MGFLWVISYIAAGCLFGFFAWKIADNKGRGGAGIFCLGFFLGIIGVLIALCLSDQRVYDQPPANESYFSRMEKEGNAQPSWECAYCGHRNTEKLSYCLHCRSERNEAQKINCPSCGAVNSTVNTTCWACQKSMKEAPSIASESPITAEFPADAQPASAADEILKFKQLADQGIITQEEFAAKKKRLLEL